MRLNIPSFRGIEAFLAAANAGSMRAAAHAMHLTVSAVSHRIQVLESELGVKLFDRAGQSLRLTEIGQRYRQDLLPSLAQMEQATSRVQSALVERRIRVATVPLLYSNWVIPRLNGFLDRFPHAQVELLSLEAKAAEEADIIIRPVYSRHARAGEIKLFGWAATPICHPDVIERYDLREPRDLARTLLIEIKTPMDLWENWFAAAGLSYADHQNRLLVDSQALMYDVVMQKLGVSIATTFFGYNYLRQGLVWPFDLVCEFPGGMYLNTARDGEAPIVREFREWLIAEVELATAQLAG